MSQHRAKIGREELLNNNKNSQLLRRTINETMHSNFESGTDFNLNFHFQAYISSMMQVEAKVSPQANSQFIIQVIKFHFEERSNAK